MTTIELPPALHDDWVRRAIEAGKHVLCEKPLAANAQLAQELTVFAKRHGRILVEAMHVRYLHRLRRQRELLAGGEFGRLLHIESCFRAPYTPMAKDDFRLSFPNRNADYSDLSIVQFPRPSAKPMETEPETGAAGCAV